MTKHTSEPLFTDADAHVIVLDGPAPDSARMFWTGSGWSSEFPDAKLYPPNGRAINAIPIKEFDRRRPGEVIRVFEGYGYAEERVVRVFRPGR